MTQVRIRLNEAELLRAGFPRDAVAALRQIAAVIGSGLEIGEISDVEALVLTTGRNDGKQSNIEQEVMRLGDQVNQIRRDSTAFQQGIQCELESLVMSVRRPMTALPATPVVAGGSGNALIVACDFGASFTDKAQTVVTGEAWVTATSSIAAQVLTTSGIDPDEMRLLNLQPVVSDIVPGDGFTLTLYSEPEARGVYNVMVSGV